MSDYKSITVPELKQKISESPLQLLDIRDPQSYEDGHIEGALNLTREKMADFIQSADKAAPVIVYCYHGNSSKAAAGMLSQQGFSDVYTLEGGYTAWDDS